MNYEEEMKRITDDFGEEFIPEGLKRELIIQKLEQHLKKLRAKVPQMTYSESFGVVHVALGTIGSVVIDLFDKTYVVRAADDEDLSYYDQAGIAWATDQIKEFCEDNGFR